MNGKSAKDIMSAGLISWILISIFVGLIWLGGQQAVDWHDTGTVTSAGKASAFDSYRMTFETTYNGTIRTQGHGSLNFDSRDGCPTLADAPCIPQNAPINLWYVGMQFGVIHHAGGYITLVRL